MPAWEHVEGKAPHEGSKNPRQDMADDKAKELGKHSAFLYGGGCRSPDSYQRSYLLFQRRIRAAEETTVKERHKRARV
jgi:hypothetical protein